MTAEKFILDLVIRNFRIGRDHGQNPYFQKKPLSQDFVQQQTSW